MNKQKLIKPVLIGCCLSLLPLNSIAASRDNQRRPPHGPPPEAITACEGRSVNDSVKFTGRWGESIEATCQEKDGKLVAVPDNMPEGGPPPR